ncbi:MAG: T9SS type A sorting domain-containing protein, partial [Ignavibacteriaceae bacterium]|nr:T9SS type A sorting domain-containing protein [Ignavibacteriaceae bacterium]
LQHNLTRGFLNGVHFTSPTNGYINGGNKILLKYTQLSSIQDEAEKPTEFKLEQNYPNPFNPVTVISYKLPVNGDVTLKIYDLLGNEVATLVDENKPAGKYKIEFNVAQVSRPEMASGIYFYQLTSGEFIQTKKMVLIK